MALEIRELKMVLAVARQGSISAAAESLHCVQSNVTARIRQLEDRLNTPLFHRRSRGVTPTRAGQLLVDYAERIIRLASEAENAVTRDDAAGGKLLIGSMETTAAVRLPPVLARYHSTHPQVELNLITGTSEETLQRLLDYQVDAALVAGEISHQELVAEKAYEEELVLVTAVDQNPLEPIENLKILVFRQGCSYRARLEDWLRQTGRFPYKTVELGSIEGILGCITAGMGVSFLPRSVVERPTLPAGCAIHPLQDDAGRMTTWLVSRRDESMGKALQAFRNMVLKGV